MNQAALLRRIVAIRREAPHPLVVGISGYCGSGKSTLARNLVAALPGSVRMRGDDFLDPSRSHHRSSDWEGVDRRRLASEVLTPHQSLQPGVFHRFDWSTRALGAPESLPPTDLLVVDVIGPFYPEALPSIDMAVWCDVDLDTAVRQGIARDRELGRDHEALWREVWEPNERDFAGRFAPRERADVLYASDW